jgi:hypothetical protein
LFPVDTELGVSLVVEMASGPQAPLELADWKDVGWATWMEA